MCGDRPDVLSGRLSTFVDDSVVVLVAGRAPVVFER